MCIADIEMQCVFSVRSSVHELPRETRADFGKAREEHGTQQINYLLSFASLTFFPAASGLVFVNVGVFPWNCRKILLTLLFLNAFAGRSSAGSI